ncbi:related to agmatinase [Phialocephala subalpina]|uniref:Related to agmatinase n=1 Tax=Phialocephala subalpina TaxID=576137 RepID=A0A1L7XJM3_9HELO|nr:related to agmatinase [Phialocephala subalpina]
MPALLSCTSVAAVLSLVQVVAPSPLQISAQLPIIQAQAEKYDLEPSAEYPFSGITTFYHLGSAQCLTNQGKSDDILVVGLPFDTATSFRTGTRFGPNAIRQGSRAVSLTGDYNYHQALNPFTQGLSIVDCGDFPISPFDNGLAFAQMEEWYSRLLAKEVKNPHLGIASSKTGKAHPKIIALGGDHSVSLPILRALNKVYGPVSAIHIDAHIDTWNPKVFARAKGAASEQAQFSDGTPYYWVGMEGLLINTCVYAGIRSSLDSAADLVTDAKSGFTIIPAWEMLKKDGVQGIINKIRSVVDFDKPVYISLDVDSLDPAFAPGTAGPSAGGWTPREVIEIVVGGLKGMNIVGVDIVEVLPGMDTAEITAIAAADFAFELITTIVTGSLEASAIGKGMKVDM